MCGANCDYDLDGGMHEISGQGKKVWFLQLICIEAFGSPVYNFDALFANVLYPHIAILSFLEPRSYLERIIF